MAKMLSAVAVAVLLTTVGLANAKEPVKLTDKQLNKVTAGAFNANVPIAAALVGNGAGPEQVSEHALVVAVGHPPVAGGGGSDAFPELVGCRIKQVADVLVAEKEASLDKTIYEEELLQLRWKPAATVGGDIYADELSFSPEGKWMAVAHLGIHLGEGERIVEIHGVDIKEVPACR